jgi:glycosyltransferase involved in cell wall biosynthesis
MTTKLQVLPNGIDTGIFHPDATVRAQLRSELQLGEEFLWIAAGRMEAVKDYPTMLRAMAQLPDRARLVVAGSGPMEGEIKVLCEQLGLNARVHFVGFDPEVQRWMQAADGFVLASRWEGLPLGLLEAAACGLPGVATDVPGSREAVIAGETGLLATANNVQALAQAMNQLMQMAPAERKAMGDKAREMVLERFGIEAVLDRWESLYEQLLACNTSPKRVSGRAIVRR